MEIFDLKSGTFKENVSFIKHLNKGLQTKNHEFFEENVSRTL